MARYVTKVRTRRPAVEVFAFMADLRNLVEWDPGVKRAAMVEGDAIKVVCEFCSTPYVFKPSEFA